MTSMNLNNDTYMPIGLKSVSPEAACAIGMEIASRYFRNEASASTFVLKFQGRIRQSTSFGVTDQQVGDMWIEAIEIARLGMEFAKPWEYNNSSSWI